MNTTIPHFCIVLALTENLGLFPDKPSTLFHYTLNYLKNVGVKKENIRVIGNELACLSYADSLKLAYVKAEPEKVMNEIIKAGRQRLQESGEPFSLIVLFLDNPAREHDLLEQVITTTKARPGELVEVAYKTLTLENEIVEWVPVSSGSIQGVWYDQTMDANYKKEQNHTGLPQKTYYVFQNVFCGSQLVRAEPYYNQPTLDLAVEEAYKMSITTAFGDDKFPRVILIDVPEKSN